MSKIMLINDAGDETRVAIVVDGVLQDLHIESKENNRIKGDIYKGTVVRVEPAIQACFVEFS